MPNWGLILDRNIRPVIQFFSSFFGLIPLEIFYLLLFIPTFLLVFSVVRHGKDLLR